MAEWEARCDAAVLGGHARTAFVAAFVVRREVRVLLAVEAAAGFWSLTKVERSEVREAHEMARRWPRGVRK